MEDKTETQVVEQNAVTESVAAETPKRKTRTKKAAEKTVKPIVPKDIDPEQYVTVRNGFQGRLVYVSKHTGVRIEDFDEIFQKDAKTISEIISDMSDGQKKSVAYRARVLIADGAIDSNKAITALEESLGVELVERDR